MVQLPVAQEITSPQTVCVTMIGLIKQRCREEQDIVRLIEIKSKNSAKTLGFLKLKRVHNTTITILISHRIALVPWLSAVDA